MTSLPKVHGPTRTPHRLTAVLEHSNGGTYLMHQDFRRMVQKCLRTVPHANASSLKSCLTCSRSASWLGRYLFFHRYALLSIPSTPRHLRVILYLSLSYIDWPTECKMSPSLIQAPHSTPRQRFVKTILLGTRRMSVLPQATALFGYGNHDRPHAGGRQVRPKSRVQD